MKEDDTEIHANGTVPVVQRSVSLSYETKHLVDWQDDVREPSTRPLFAT